MNVQERMGASFVGTAVSEWVSTPVFSGGYNPTELDRVLPTPEAARALTYCIWVG